MLAVTLPATFADTPATYDLALVAQMNTMRRIHTRAKVTLGDSLDGRCVSVDGVRLEAWQTFVAGNGHLSVAVTSTIGSTGISADSNTINDDNMAAAIIDGVADAYLCSPDDLTLNET